MDLASLIDGLLLGDASIHPKGYLQIEQATKRLPWLRALRRTFAKAGLKSNMTVVPSRTRIIEGREIVSSGGAVLFTACTPALKAERVRWYSTGHKRVPADVRIDPISIAAWFAGDGTSDQNGMLMFCTDGFDPKDVVLLSKKLTELGVVNRTDPGRGSSLKIRIPQRDMAQHLKEMIWDHLPVCCRYKLRFVRPAIPRGEAQRALRKLSNRQIAEALAAKKAGASFSQLAAKYQVSVSTLHNYLKKER